MLLWVLIATVGRLMPHPANVTPLTSLSILSSRYFNVKQSALITLLSLFLSDVLLAFFQGYSIFGTWSLFTYSGFLSITLLNHRFLHKVKNCKFFGQFFICTGFSVLGYWLWTNFGTWLCTTLYPHSLPGLMNCYTAALPFLRNALIGGLAWSALLYALLSWRPARQIFYHI